MLKVQPNSRQIPDIERYTADKRYSDLLYGYLQEISYLEDGQRYVDKKKINFTKLAQKLNLSRNTIAKKFKSLLVGNEADLNLIEYDEKHDRYKLKVLDAPASALVPFETLRIINNALSANCISIYVYLLDCYCANEEHEFPITMRSLKSFIGLATSTTSNNDVINDILKVLEKLGLIKYELRQVEEEKSQLYITFVTNKI